MFLLAKSYAAQCALPISSVNISRVSHHGSHSILRLVVVLSLIAGVELAHTQVLPFHILSVDDGLLQSTVYCVFQDSQGFLWIGTQDGVSRYDGYSFTNFTTDHGLVNNRVLCIEEDQDGFLWFGTAGGVSQFLGDRFELPDIPGDLQVGNVHAINFDADRTIWLGTQHGLARVRPHDSTGQRGMHSHIRGDVYALYRDKKGTLWAGLGSGVAAVTDGSVKTYGAESGLPAIPIKCFAEDANGNLYLGTEGKGTYRKEGDAFSSYARTSQEESMEVYALCFDDEGQLWVGSYGDGVVRHSEGVSSMYSTPNGLPSKVVRSIIQDREGNMWFGTYAGIARLGTDDIQAYTTAQGLSHNTVMAIEEDGEGGLVFGTYGGGVSILSRGRFRTLDISSGLPHNTVRAILRDRRGALWFGTHKGLAHLSGRNIKVYDKRHGIAGEVVLALHEDNAGRIWIGTFDRGASVLNGRNIENYDTSNGLLSNRVRTIGQDSMGNIWLGTEAGLSRFDGTGFTHFTKEDGLANNTIRSITIRRDGSLWAATDGGGISVFRDGSFTNYNTKDGLVNNVCFFSLEDDHGDMWIGTNKGISRFDGTSFRTYSVKDGLVSNEMNSGAALKDHLGNLWFGSSGGVTKIHPASVSVQRSPTPVYITRLVVFNREVSFSPSLRLEHSQNSPEFHFVGIFLSASHALEYRYKLEDVDDDWRTTTHTSAFYASVPPGSYVFSVNARSFGGEWSPQPATLAFEILPPLWGTWWFRLMAAVAGLLGIGLVVLRRMNTAREQQQVQHEFSRRLIESQEVERKRIASGLHDSLGQNLLVLKNILDQSATNNELKTDVRKELKELSELAQLSLNEVREISFDLHPHVLDRLGLQRAIETMVEKLNSSFPVVVTARFEGPSFKLGNQLEIGIYRIAQEALSNVVKHSEARTASVMINARNGVLELKVVDDGRGFDAPAHLARPPGRWSLGLVNIAERVRLLNGTYSINSRTGEGTTLTVHIPLNSHPASSK